MTNLTPKSQFDDVYQLERNDPALAGPGGVLNKPLQNLTNRTEFLNDTKANKTDIVKGQYSFTTLAKFNEKKATIPANSTVIIEEAGANQGTNNWDGTTLTKSVYDPLAQAKADATTKAATAKSEAITAAATDSSNYTNAKINELLQIIRDLKSDSDQSITRLFVSIEQMISVILDLQDEFDTTSTNQSTALTSYVTALQLEDSNINARLTGLLVAIQQLIQTVSTEFDEIETSIAYVNTAQTSALNAAVSASQLEDSNINARLTGLLVAIQQLIQTVSTEFDELDQYLPIITNNNDAITRLNLAIQSLITEILNVDDSGGSTISKEFTALSFALPTPQRIIRIEYTTGSTLPTAKGTVIKGDISINVDGESFVMPATLEVQGSSSSSYPKKNWTFGFFSDDTFVNSVDLKIGDVLPHSEWVFKSNWIDASHIRQAMSYNLWAQIMSNRVNGYPLRDIDTSYVLSEGVGKLETGASAHPVLYPAVIYINGSFYGIGSLGIGKKRANYNIPKNEPKKIHLEMSNWSDLKLLKVDDPELIEIKAPSKPNDETRACFQAWRDFCAMPQADFTANFDTYLNKQNVMDFILFADFIYFSDGIQWDNAKNFQLITWNGTQWFFMPYDLDTTYGLNWAGTEISSPANSNTRFDGGFWIKVKTALGVELNNRYKYLRNKGVFASPNIYSLARNISSKYTLDLYKAEQTAWPTLPSLNFSNIEQIITWSTARIEKMDSIYNYSN